MALSIEVSKVSVLESMPSLWSISVKLIILEGAVEVYNKDFSIKYRLGENIDAKQQEVLETMQSAIDSYKSEQQIFDHAKTDDLITFLTESLVV